MFIKSFKQKSNVPLKSSDQKRLKQRISQHYSNINENILSNLFPNKSTVTLIKIITSAGISTNIYAVDKRPMFFEDENKELIPTIYTLWIITDLLPYFTTHPAVLPILANGADLMLRGVIRVGTGLNSYGHYKKDTLVAVNLTSNKAAIGVGRLVRSSEDLFMSGGYGPCVKFLNIYGDNLWGFEPSVSLQMPIFDSVINVPTSEDFPPLNADRTKCKKISEDVQPNVFDNISEEIVNMNVNTTDENVPDDWEDIQKIENIDEKPDRNMDDVLLESFLTALKKDGKQLTLPILTSNFFRLHVLTNSDIPIDMKQTSYKKFTNFLTIMVEKNFIVVKEETKGIKKIISINFDHPELVNFIPTNMVVKKSDSKQAPLFHVQMTKLYIVTDETIEFFTKYNVSKGEGITGTQVKSFVKEYIINSKCAKNNNLIVLDTCLSKICNTDILSFDDIYQRILSKMISTFEMRGKNETKFNKPPIHISTATRTHNKKVTLVNNLESYGIILSEFSKVCKQGAGASTSIIKSPNQKQDQFQIQGNQTKFIQKLLTETYKIPANQIHGGNLATKSKK